MSSRSRPDVRRAFLFWCKWPGGRVLLRDPYASWLSVFMCRVTRIHGLGCVGSDRCRTARGYWLRKYRPGHQPH